MVLKKSPIYTDINNSNNTLYFSDKFVGHTSTRTYYINNKVIDSSKIIKEEYVKYPQGITG